MRYLKNKLKQFILSIIVPILDQHKKSIESMIEAKFSAIGACATKDDLGGFPPQVDIRVDRKTSRR